MSSSSKTPLGFNIWAGTDTPKMDDFNSDNRITDTEITRLDDRIDNIVLPENVAIKDGTLQQNLNSEMLGGKKLEELDIEIPENVALLSEFGAINWDSGNLPIASGTFTPKIRGGTTAGNPVYNVTETVGKWMQQGKIVRVQFSIVLTGLGGMAGNVEIYNFPVLPIQTGYGAAISYGGITLPSGFVLSGQIISVAGITYLRRVGNTGHAIVQASELSNSFSLYDMWLEYIIN